MFGMGMVFAFACSLGWVASDALRKRLSTQCLPMDLAVWLSAGQLLILMVLVPILLSIGGLGSWSTWHLASDYWYYALPTFIFTAIGHVLFLRALHVSELGLTIPYLSFSPIFVMLFAMMFLQEWPTSLALVGLLTVALGAFFLNPSRRGQGEGDKTSADFRDGALSMLATAICWSAAAAFDKAALKHASSLVHLLLLLVSTVLILGIARMLHHREGDGSKPSQTMELSVVFIVCFTMLIALALQFAAYSYWDVAYVEAVKRAVGLVGSVVVGNLFFQEHQLKKRLVAVAVMAVGTTLILIGG